MVKTYDYSLNFSVLMNIFIFISEFVITLNSNLLLLISIMSKNSKVLFSS